jgi:ParB family protein of integrating conjugative element (PFGI_1 class)
MSKAKQLAQNGGLGARIVEGVFGKARELPPADPAHAMSMVIPVERIDPYDRNPRREDNKLYEKLKESIAAAGLDAPIGVTRRPGAERYMVAAGGNTRLTIVQELWRETRDERFRQAICVFRPWVSEVDILAAHLRENDLRDNLTFIDHATAILALKALIEEAEGAKLKTATFEQRLKRLGHEVSRRDLARMAYAKRIESSIPIALKEGMGPWTVDKIHLQRRNYQAWFEGLEIGSKPPFDDIFERALKENDSDGFDIESFRASLDAALAEAAGMPSRRVRLAVDAIGGKAESDGGGAEAEAEAGPSPEESFDAAEAPEHSSAGASSAQEEAGAAPAPVDPPPRERDGDNRPNDAVPAAPRRSPGRERLLVEKSAGLAPAFPAPAASLRERPRTASAFPEAPGPSAEPAFPSLDPAAMAYLDPAVEAGRERFPGEADAKFLRARAYSLSSHFAAQGGIGPCLREEPSRRPFGLTLRPLPDGASERQTVFWHALASLLLADDQDGARSAAIARPDFFRRFVFRAIDDGPPSPAVLKTFLLLVESVVALARATSDRSKP